MMCVWLQVNRIRQSLQVMAANSSTFGLRQPHLQRTRLCELPDSELDPGYVRQRSQLHDLVTSLAKPKVHPPPPPASLCPSQSSMWGRSCADIGSRLCVCVCFILTWLWMMSG